MIWLFAQATPTPPLGGFPLPLDQLLGPYGAVVVLACWLGWVLRKNSQLEERLEDLDKETRTMAQKYVDLMMTRDNQR